MKPYTVERDAIRLAVRFTPRARKDALAGIIDAGAGRAALAIRLTAPPVDGAANQALIAFLASALGLPKSAVTIATGDKARLKIVRLAGVTVPDVERLLI
ncbi:DUF167 domain-containing protein [Sphingosinicella sp. BN140058]|uniref:DUF167 domain-containing protein n=1 Tax=Sphingosinicella sp. BN140058 TaxID=1892855 RepID=UPI00101254BD|nr:DUF167 domain-containing protein [Sphingosinicella sp. BN140058]QAY79118.1 DUF167 domain-containing protein [Sphingosinicella sp. BN140058]